MLKAQKTELLKEVTKDLLEAQTIVFVDYTGLNMTMQQELKKRLKEVGARMVVVKNTLIRLAGTQAKLTDEALTDSVLSGQTAVILSSSDPIAPIQVIGKFVKEFSLPKFKVGIIEGSFQDATNLTKLSKLPSKEILFGQVVGAIASPMYGLVFTLNANMQKLVFILEQVKILDQKAKGVTN